MWNFKEKRVLVVGLGRSGAAAVRFLVDRKARVTVTDQKSEEELAPVLAELGPGLQGVVLGRHPVGLFGEADLIVLSPGVRPDLPGLRLARKRRVSVVGEFGLATELLPTPLIAITGTNGKSTTCSLVSKMLNDSGSATALAGNIGRPLLDLVTEGKEYDWVVAETSSFQLETVRHFHPRVAAILNVSPDHLDRYPNLAAYAHAKFRIFSEQTSRDLLVTPAHDRVVARGVGRARSRRLTFSSEGPLKAGLFYQDGTIVSLPRRGPPETYSLTQVKLSGLHNQENMMAAVGIARFCGVSSPSIQRSLESFEGLPHRMELVREVRGVRYINDSKGTNVDAVVKSLASLPTGRVILIAGGYDKGGSYRPLVRPVKEKVRLLLLIGQAAGRLRGELGGGVKGATAIASVGTLSRAVRRAAEAARPGDVVLLSPACASYDQFRDFEDRGEQFRKMVTRL